MARAWNGINYQALGNRDSEKDIALARDHFKAINEKLFDVDNDLAKIRAGVKPGTINVPIGGVTDHGDLTGLGDDDHPQYLLLAGRNGQTISDEIGIGVAFDASYPLTVSALNYTPRRALLLQQWDSAGGRALDIAGDDTTPLGDAISIRSNGGTNRARWDANGRIGVRVGTGTLDAAIDVAALANGTVGARVRQASSSQTANLQEWSDNAGTTDLSWITAAGDYQTCTPVNLTGQTGNIGTTTAFTTTHAGMYQIAVYVKTTTAGAGGDIISAVTIGWNDGAAQTKNALEANHNLAVLNSYSAPRVFTVYVASGQTITYATTCTITGAPVYDLRIRVKSEG